MIIVTEAELKRNYIRKDQLVSVLESRASALSMRTSDPLGRKDTSEIVNDRLAQEFHMLANAIQNLR